MISMQRFHASVQYDDWVGSVAADNSDAGSLRAWMEARGGIPTDEVLVGFDVFVGEKIPGRAAEARVSAYLMSVEATNSLQASDVPTVNEVSFSLTPEEFHSVFKRFALTLTTRHLKLDGRDYRIGETRQLGE
jgi:hypothetical protein